MAEIMEYIEKMEKITGKKFGDLENPLLVSVRSGARASMPGMMDTILNLGLNEDVVEVSCQEVEQPADGLGTATEDSFRCSPTSLWKSARSTLKQLIDEDEGKEGRQARRQNLTRTT